MLFGKNITIYFLENTWCRSGCMQKIWSLHDTQQVSRLVTLHAAGFAISSAEPTRWQWST